MNEKQQAAAEERHALITKMQASDYHPSWEQKEADVRRGLELGSIINPVPAPAPIQRTARSVSREPASAVVPAGGIPGYWLSRFLGDSPWMATYGNAALGWRDCSWCWPSGCSVVDRLTGFILVPLAKGSVLVLSRREYLRGLQRGKRWRRQQAMAKRLEGADPPRLVGEAWADWWNTQAPRGDP